MKKGKLGKQATIPDEAMPLLPPMTDEERAASRAAYERCKPTFEAALAKIGERSKPIVPLSETVGLGHVPNTYRRCTTHGLPLDPWDLCHHGCRRCQREAPYVRIWTHKGSCHPTASVLVGGKSA